jgi:hypothetical protein
MKEADEDLYKTIDIIKKSGHHVTGRQWHRFQFTDDKGAVPSSPRSIERGSTFPPPNAIPCKDVSSSFTKSNNLTLPFYQVAKMFVTFAIHRLWKTELNVENRIGVWEVYCGIVGGVRR